MVQCDMTWREFKRVVEQAYWTGLVEAYEGNVSHVARHAGVGRARARAGMRGPKMSAAKGRKKGPK